MRELVLVIVICICAFGGTHEGSGILRSDVQEEKELCTLEGVECDTADHVTKLYARNIFYIVLIFSRNLRSRGFDGSIPLFIGDLEHLIHLYVIYFVVGLNYSRDLSENHFAGNIPPSFSKLRNLQTLDLSNNELSGTVDILLDLPSLRELNISHNTFSGTSSYTFKLTICKDL
jgi:hypothetical protein